MGSIASFVKGLVNCPCPVHNVAVRTIPSAPGCICATQSRSNGPSPGCWISTSWPIFSCSPWFVFHFLFSMRVCMYSVLQCLQKCWHICSTRCQPSSRPWFSAVKSATEKLFNAAPTKKWSQTSKIVCVLAERCQLFAAPVLRRVARFPAMTRWCCDTAGIP